MPAGPRRRWPWLLVGLLAVPAAALFARGGAGEPEAGIPVETPAAAEAATPTPQASEPGGTPTPTPVPPPVARGTWHDLGNAPVAVPADHHAVWTGEELVVFGFGGEVAAYDVDASQWRALPDLPLPAGHAAPPPVWTGTRLVAFSGGDADGEVAGRLAAATLEPHGDGWRPAASSPLPALHEAVAVWTGRVAVVWGTVAGGQKAGAVYDPAADEWRSMPQAPVPAAERIGAVWTDREVVVYGQRYARPGATFAAAFDPHRGHWRRLPGPPVAGHAIATAAAVWTGREVVLLRDGYLQERDTPWDGMALRVEEPEPEWGLVAAPGAEADRLAQVASAGAWTGEHVALVGALTGSDGWLYHPRSGSWWALPVGGGRRLRPAVAWTGDRLLVWGGYTPLGPTVDLVAFEPADRLPRLACDPDGDGEPVTAQGFGHGAGQASAGAGPVPAGWTRSEPAPLVTSRRNWPPTAVEWTAVAAGEQFLVFPSVQTDRDAPLPGAALDLASGRWACLPDAPLAQRRGAVAVWTGEEVVVWGGHAQRGLGDGAAYHPPTRSWRRLPPAPVRGGIPQASAWTGTELLVWGLVGPGPGGPPTGGAAYDPWSDQWRSFAHGPDGLTRVASTWTGAELMVAGWPHDASPTDPPDAFAYDPTSDAWRPVAPPPLNPVAMSLAQSLGVVAGWDYDAGAATYDRETDAWEPLPDPPLRPGECWPVSAGLGDGHVLAWFCTQAALLDVRERTWRPVDPPAEAVLALVGGERGAHAITRSGAVLTFRP